MTRFPFGLFEKTRIVPARESCVVFPAVEGEGRRRSPAKRAPMRSASIGWARRSSAFGVSFPTTIPAGSTGGLGSIGEWMVTEHAQTLDRPVAVFFDSRGPAGEGFEAAVERAASLVWGTSRDGRGVRLFSWGRSFREEGPVAVRAALTFLAEVQPTSGERLPAGDREFREWRREVERYGGGVFVTAGEPPDLPPGTILRVA
jgi:uncharacterized protein (DUF58 family)